jgi:hypothetical protein
MLVAIFAGCAIGITVAHFAEKPEIQSVSHPQPPVALVIRGNFGAIDTVDHQVLFNTIDPYTIDQTVPLQIQYGTDTRIYVGIGDLRAAGYRSAPGTTDDIKPGTAGYVILGRKSGSLHALTIFDTGMKETDL